MGLGDSSTYYEVLEVSPDASPQEIRAAYLRAKAAYKRDSVALYTLISEEETQELVQKIEEAYQILSNPEKRKHYDQNHGFIPQDPDFLQTPRLPRSQKIVSIDRVPPMETNAVETDILVPPATDFSISDFEDRRSQHFSSAPATTRVSNMVPQQTISGNSIDAALANQIANETVWSGPFIRSIREAKGVAVEEISESTRISKTYLRAIEDESFSKLPAPVYLRGFLTQICRFLKLPTDKVVEAYMSRYKQGFDDNGKLKTSR